MYYYVLLSSLTVDYNRVVLENEDGIPDSDYINASYVDVSNSESFRTNGLMQTCPSSSHRVWFSPRLILLPRGQLRRP